MVTRLLLGIIFLAGYSNVSMAIKDKGLGSAKVIQRTFPLTANQIKACLEDFPAPTCGCSVAIEKETRTHLIARPIQPKRFKYKYKGSHEVNISILVNSGGFTAHIALPFNIERKALSEQERIAKRKEWDAEGRKYLKMALE